MKKFGVRRSMITLVALTLCIALAFFLFPQRQEHWTVKIATATPGGTYYPLGAQLAHILKELPERQIRGASIWETSGSVENIRLLCNPRSEYRNAAERERAQEGDSADLAFVQQTALAMASPDQREKIRAIAGLYRDVVQVVARRDSGVTGLADLKGKRVYVGRDRSGTKQIAEAILGAAGIRKGDYTRKGETESFIDATRKLQKGDLDVAIFCSGTPTDCVEEALLEGECYLVNVNVSPERIQASTPAFDQVLTQVEIPASFYEGQRKSINTLATQVILAARKDLDNHLVSLILDTLFDNVRELLRAHARAEDIRFQEASDPKSFGPIESHRGSVKFWEREKEKLLIATGALPGKYHDIGRVIDALLEENNIRARAIHTDGSVENAMLLQDPERPVLAIMQHDTALATYLGRSSPVY